MKPSFYPISSIILSAAIALLACLIFGCKQPLPLVDTIEGPVEELRTAHASCRVALYGGRVLSFTAAGGETIWRPACWHVTGEKWSHGGIPICWPWFGASGPDPKVCHGFAWKKMFTRRSKNVTPEKTELVLGLVDDEDTRRRWPYAFDLEYRITLTDRLRLELRTTNRDAKPFQLTCGLHPYFAIGERDGTYITGTDGMASCDSRVTTRYDRLWKGDLKLLGTYDDVFVEKGPTASHTLVDPTRGRQTTVDSKGAARLVVWNPNPETDIPAVLVPGGLDRDDWRHVVCVEPAILWKEAARTVAPGATHTLEATISVR